MAVSPAGVAAPGAAAINKAPTSNGARRLVRPFGNRDGSDTFAIILPVDARPPTPEPGRKVARPRRGSSGRSAAFMGPDGGKEDAGEIAQLGRADAVDDRELVLGARLLFGHVGQRPVGEDDIGRHLTLAREAQAQLLEGG